MKTYRAIYDRGNIKGVQYDFTAKSDNHAVKFVNIKFTQECRASLRLFEGDREIPHEDNPHDEMSISEKEAFVGAKFVK